MQKMNKAEN